MKKRKRKKRRSICSKELPDLEHKESSIKLPKKKNNNKEKNLAKKATQSGKEILVLVVVSFFRSIVVGLSKCNNFNYF